MCEGRGCKGVLRWTSQCVREMAMFLSWERKEGTETGRRRTVEERPFSFPESEAAPHSSALTRVYDNLKLQRKKVSLTHCWVALK